MLIKISIRILMMVQIALLLSGCTGAQAGAPTTATTAPAATQPGRAAPAGLPTPSSPTQVAEAAPAVSHPTATAAIPTGQITPARAGSTSAPPTSSPRAPTPLPTLKPDEWQKLPVVPQVSERVLEIYRRGVELGNNPQAFSKLGDCGSTPAWFLGDFDRGPSYYRLGEYSELEAVIEEFQGSFSRTSLAARSGFNVSALFTPLWSDRKFCQAGESPLACEYRVQRPSMAFIMLGTNDVWRPQEFEPQMRRAIEFSIEQGVIPILATKADNQEGDGSINATIARLAREYDLPLWNYWAAVNALPNHGLQEDEAHLTWGRNLFDDEEAMTKAWPVRNLTALQALDAVWKKIQSEK